jgi:hypothetical protein
MLSWFLVGSTLVLAQVPPPPTEVPPDAAEFVVPALPLPAPAGPTGPPAAPHAAADRWPLMLELQGTPAGAVLDDNRLRLYGWTEMSFTGSTDTHDQLPMGFNYLANDFLLQQNWLRFERTVVTSGTTEPTFGFRTDTILPGSDYRFTVARGLFSGQLTADHGQPNVYGIDPIQFYGEAYFPTVGRGLDVKIGRFFAQYGIEANDTVSNALASHAYTFIYDPFTHTGALTTTKLTDAWTVQAGMALGCDVFIDQADTPTFIGSVRWAPPGGRDTAQLSVIACSGRFDVGRNFNNPNILDFFYVHQFSAVLTYSFEGLVGYQDNVPDIGTAHWFGLLNYATYTLSPRVSTTARLEFFDDAQGQRTGFEGLYTALTAGVSLRVWNYATFRPELRYDYNGESRPFEGHHGVFTAAADVVIRW